MTSAQAALPTALLDKMQKILVFELTATNLRGTLRQLTRKELLEEARAASLPEAVRAGGAPASDLLLLKARDVRKVDPVFGGRIEPVILVRTGVILVSLGRTELRALILHDRLYFIVPDGADSVLTAVQQNLTQLREAEAGALSPHLQPTPGLHDLSQEMRGIDDPAVALPPQAAAAAPPQPPLPVQASTELSAHLQHLEPDGVMPFEFSALEALLMTACTELHTRAAGLQTAVRDALLSLRQTIGTGWRSPASQQLENLRDLKQQVHELLVQSQQLDHAIEELLEEDIDMTRMYLSKLHTHHAQPLTSMGGGGVNGLGPSPSPSPSPLRRSASAHTPPEVEVEAHEEVEMLLENYAQELGAATSLLELLAYSIESDEKFFSYRLDSARNRLLKVDVMATIAATAFGAGSLVASIFGMNIKSELFEEGQDNWIFDVTVGGIVIGVFLLLVGMLSCLYGRQDGAQAAAAAGGGCFGCVSRGAVEQRGVELPRLVGI